MLNAKYRLLQGPDPKAQISGQIQRLIYEMRSTFERTASRVLAAAEKHNRAA